MKSKIAFLGLFLLTMCSSEDTINTRISSGNISDEIATSEVISDEVMGHDIRPEVGGAYGAVVSGHPLASQIGYEVLRNGGNATDAAVSMAAVLTVVRPHMNSIGGDAFSLFYDSSTGKVVGLNGSGRAGALATSDFFTEKGLDRVPFSGAGSITVPGAVSAWYEALATYGSLSWQEALQPAVEIAENGFTVTQTLAEDLHNASMRLNDAGQAIYRPTGEPLKAGDRLTNRALAQTLRTLQQQGPEALYGGSIGNTLSNFILEQGGALTTDDFRSHVAEWQSPISITFRGHKIHTTAPNSQGIAMLQMLGMAEQIDFSTYTSNESGLLHELIEITKVAFADRDRWVYDPTFESIPIDQLLDKNYLRERYVGVDTTASFDNTPGLGDEAFSATHAHLPAAGDTVYLMAVDSDGNAVSWIQSLFGTFGSNLVEPTTGIVLQNRGAGFSLEAGTPNEISPGKRPFHTLMSTLITSADDQFLMAIGTPGGGGQPQFITQAIIQSLVYQFSPQQAAEAPRYRIGSGTTVELESRLPSLSVEELAARGHNILVTHGWTANFGSIKIIQRLPNGALRTGADMRREATAMAY